MLVRDKEVKSLADQIVSKLPSWLFKSEQTTFVDPAVASGSYLLAVKQRLESFGHDKYNIQSRLFAFSNSRIQQNVIRKRFGLEPTFIRENFLESSDLYFDVVIGNPPYQNGDKSENVKGGGGKGNIYPKFVDEAWEKLNPNGVCAMVVPTNYFCTTSWGQIAKKNESTIKRNLIEIQTNIEKHFNVGTDISYFIAEKSTPKGSPIVNGESSFCYNKYLLIPKHISPIAISVLEKLTDPNKKRYSFIREKKPNGNSVCFISMQGARVSATGELKFHDELNGSGKSGLLYHSCENVKKFKEILHHPCFKFFMIMTKNSGVVYPGIMNACCMPPEDIDISLLYKWYGLSKEEIAFVEKVTK